MKKMNRLALIACAAKISDFYRKSLQDLSHSPLIIEPQSSHFCHQELQDSDGLIIGLDVTLDAPTLKFFSKLRYIGVCGSSIKRIDLDYTKKKNITVTNVLEYCDQETALFTIYQLISLAKGMNTPSWKKRPQSLSAYTLGILGMGAVGKEIAKIAFHLGMKIIYHNTKPCLDPQYSFARYVTKEELLQQANFISINTPAYLPIMDSRDFAMLREDAVVINTTLGKTYDEEALKKWLSPHKGLMVFDQIATPPSFTHERLIITKENAHVTEQTLEVLAQKTFCNLKNFLCS